MKTKMKVLTSAVAIAAGFGIATNATAEDDIVIGHLTYHTGEYGGFGPFFDGVTEMSLSKINEDPPLGRPLVAIHQDIGTVGEARAARKLVDSDSVDILLNPAHSYMSYRDFILDTVSSKGLPLMPSVHGGAIEEAIGGVVEEPIFRGAPMDTAQGIAALLHAKNAGKKSIVVVAAETSGSQLQKDAALRTYEAMGLELLDDIDIDGGASNFRSVITRINRLEPDAVIVYSSPQAGGSFVKNAAESGASWFIVGPSEWQETEFYDTATESALAQHQAVHMTAYSHEDNPAWEAYEPFASSSKWSEDIGDVSNSYAIQYYDLLVATALAIEKSGELNNKSWTQAMYDVTGGDGDVVYTYEDGLAALREGKEINYDGVTGSMEYTDTGVVSGIFGIFDWEDGAVTQIDVVDGDEVLKLDSM